MNSILGLPFKRKARPPLVEQIQLNQITRLDIYADELVELGGIESLVNLLRQNSSVTHLFVRIEIGLDGVKLIAQLLQQKTHLQDLELRNAGDEGAKIIAEAIRVNRLCRRLTSGEMVLGLKERKL
jgi:hypothetical protein